MATVHIGHFAVKYRFPSQAAPVRERLRRILQQVLDEGLPAALGSSGLSSEEHLCIRSLRAPVRLNLRSPDTALVARWSLGIAGALRELLQHAPQEAVRYASMRQALCDLLCSFAAGDRRRVWAWQDLGLVGQVLDEETVAGALLAQPPAIVPVLSEVARQGLLPALVKRLFPAQWWALAAAALTTVRARTALLTEALQYLQTAQEPGSVSGPGSVQKPDSVRTDRAGKRASQQQPQITERPIPELHRISARTNVKKESESTAVAELLSSPELNPAASECDRSADEERIGREAEQIERRSVFYRAACALGPDVEKEDRLSLALMSVAVMDADLGLLRRGGAGSVQLLVALVRRHRESVGLLPRRGGVRNVPRSVIDKNERRSALQSEPELSPRTQEKGVAHPSRAAADADSVQSTESDPSLIQRDVKSVFQDPRTEGSLAVPTAATSVFLEELGTALATDSGIAVDLPHGAVSESPHDLSTLSLQKAASGAQSESLLHCLRQEGFTQSGGLLFLLKLFGDLQLDDPMIKDALLGRRPLRWCIHQLALRLHPLKSEDPAALAFAGLRPLEPPPSRGELPPTPEEQERLDGLVVMLINALRERLDEHDLSDPELLAGVCLRPALILADPGWFAIRFSLDQADPRIRRAGLDLDPGFLPFLGIVLTFVYAP